jgi:hypothetical protein
MDMTIPSRFVGQNRPSSSSGSLNLNTPDHYHHSYGSRDVQLALAPCMSGKTHNCGHVITAVLDHVLLFHSNCSGVTIRELYAGPCSLPAEVV